MNLPGFRRLLAPALAGFAVLVLTAHLLAPSLAHEGHDHGPPPPELPNAVKPRVSAHTDAYELVAIANGERLIVYLDRYADNAPVLDAQIEILVGATAIPAQPQADGTYGATLPAPAASGRTELIFNIRHPSGDDLLAGVLDIPAAALATNATPATPGGASQGPAPRGVDWAVAGLIGVLSLLAGLALGRGLRRPVVALALACAVSTLAPQPVRAHEGHGPSPAPSASSLFGEAPRRLADGSVFLPKPSQRLISVRTQVADEGVANRTVTLVGRTIADPNRAGIVQSINGGRIAPPPGGLPRLGQAVKAGEVLAVVQPALPLADQSVLAEKARELEGQIQLGEQRLARFNRLSEGNVARSQIEDVELEIANTRRRLESLRTARILPETLVAPIDGVISAARVVAGQVVRAEDQLFQIVDPGGLWIEALAFDQSDPGTIVAATAVTGDGKRMDLSFEGRGRAVQQQAIVLQFSVKGPVSEAVIGVPVTVLARSAETHRGMLLPRDAVVRGPGGDSIVWQHIDPERFVARPVRIEPFDSRNVLVTGGIAPKDRIVVHGAELLAQVR
ncbi:MAG: efflux RND transporter periplasmic adaptor subunit [Hyphomicrobiaceae bacterium]